MDTDVLVIGGGISGLSVAHELINQGLQVELWEEKPENGGKIVTEHHRGYLLEHAASIMMNYRTEVDEFIRCANMSGNKRPVTANNTRNIVYRGSLHNLPSKGFSLFKSPLWSTTGKIRLLGELFISKGGSESETVSDFICRRFGREMLEKAIEPFVAGPLASHCEKAIARAALPRLTDLENRHGSVLMGAVINKILKKKTTPLAESFSFNGGMSELVTTLANTPKLIIQNNQRVTGIEKHRNGWVIQATTGHSNKSISARQVVFSIPAESAAKLLKPLDNELGHALAGIEYAPISVVHFGFQKDDLSCPANGFGYLVPRNEGMITTGCMWTSNLFQERAPANKSLLTCYLGGARNPHIADWSDDQTIQVALDELAPFHNFPNHPEMVKLVRHNRGLPVYHKHYIDKIKTVKTRLNNLRGVHIAANYIDGVSVRDRIVCAVQAGKNIVAEIQNRPSYHFAKTDKSVANTPAKNRDGREETGNSQVLTRPESVTSA